MGRERSRGARARALSLDPAYVATTERVAAHITEWVGSREALPDLKFFDHGEVMIGAALEPLTYELLARTPDAVSLLEYIRAREPEATIFMCRCALAGLGFLDGAAKLTLGEIQARMHGKAPMAVWNLTGEKRGESN